jgi:hypothetical protein
MRFAELAARLDALDDIAGDWIGGGPRSIYDVIAAAEAEVMATTPTTTDDRAWVYARLERAVANDWHDEAKAPLLAMLARAVASHDDAGENAGA